MSFLQKRKPCELSTGEKQSKLFCAFKLLQNIIRQQIQDYTPDSFLWQDGAANLH